jgi:hypothetical protein
MTIVRSKVPGPARATLIEWRARRISDPILRLRYLRGTTAPLDWPRPATRLAGALLLCLFAIQPVRDAMAPLHPPGLAAPTADRQPPAAWPVESTADHDTYSNGLRIENQYAVESRPRRYAVFAPNRPALDTAEWRTEPAGIDYHSTENHLAPLDPAHNAVLERIDEATLDYVRRIRAYHFVIDRFGRVYRVVAENEVANHAGNSIWADRQGVYLNLNAAFLGIAFEAHMGPDAALSVPQLQAGRALTDMLRSRYHLPADACVTHAQVSVNPANMQIGYHTDWARNFPFAAMGLDDNYRLLAPAVWLFGFGYGPEFVAASGGRIQPGLALAEASLQEEAMAWGLPAAQYARQLQKKYRQKTAALHSRGAVQETEETVDEQP